MSDLVSIIMPSYNSELTIKDSIMSVIAQDYENWELLIIDDCSSDETIRIVEEIATLDERVTVRKLDKNSGAGVARNEAIEKAKGRFIAFLDSDDRWRYNKLSAQVSFMKNNNYGLTYSYYQKFSTYEELGVVKSPPSVCYKELLYSNVIGCLTAMYDTELVGKVYMPLIRKRQDMGLWLKILSKIDKAYCVNEVLADYRIDTGMTQNKFKVAKHQWNFYRKELNLGLFKTSKYFFHYSIKGFIKSRL